MRPSVSRTLIFAFLLVLVLSSCAARVTYHDEVVIGAPEDIARTIDIFDITTAAAGQFINHAYLTGNLPEDVFVQYVDTVQPAVLAAFSAARRALAAYLDSRSLQTSEKLQLALSELSKSVEELAVLARAYGWSS